jgi:chemotaxis response regulator CheB
LGHQVIGIARSQENAIEMARHGSPELVVVDAKLHDDRAVQNIRRSTEAPVIFVGPQQQRRRRSGRRDPAQRVDSRALEKTIRRALPIKAALRESLSDSFRTH